MAKIDEKLNQTFGAVLRQLREGAGISQQDLAFDCDLDRTYISLLERGLRQPTISTLFALAHRLHIKPSKLLGMVEKELT